MPRKALLVCVLILLFLPCQAFGEHTALTARVVSGEAMPAPMRELVDSLSFEGNLVTDKNAFDLQADLLMNGDEQTRTGFHLYGAKKLAALESTLLGDTTLMLNMPAAMDFALKAYRHFGIPLPRAALLIPFVTADAFANVRDEWDAVFHKSEGARTVSRDDIIDFCYLLYEMTYSDRALMCWLGGLDTMCGVPSAVDDYLSALPEALEMALPEEGIVISVTDDHEIWTAGGEEVLRSTPASLWVRLSHLTGRALSLDAAKDEAGISFDLSFSDEQGDILCVKFISSALPLLLTQAGAYSASLTISGSAIPSALDAALSYEIGADGAFTASLAFGGRHFLGAEGTMLPAEEKSLDYTDGAILKAGLNFFSLSDTTLPEFVRDVKEPMLRGLIPLVLRAPTGTTTALLERLTDSGVVDMVAPEGGNLRSLLAFLLTPLGGICLTIVRTCVVSPLPIGFGVVILIASVILIAKNVRTKKRAVRTPQRGESQ